MIIFWTLSLLSSQIYFKKRGGEKKRSSEVYIFLEEKYLCTDRPVILWNSIHDSFIGAQPSPPLFLSGKKASLQSGFLSFERSKLHQVDGEVCFTCHSVELPPNEMLHTDFCLRAQGDKTVVTEWNKPLPIPFTHTQTQTHMQNTHPQTHIHAVVYTHTHTLLLESIHVRRSKSAIYSNIDISTCQEKGALKFPLSTPVKKIAGNMSDNS